MFHRKDKVELTKEEAEQFQDIADTFATMFGVMGSLNHQAPTMEGDCSCCFREHQLGHMLALYNQETEERFRIFICQLCQNYCKVYEACIYDNFEQTSLLYKDTLEKEKKQIEK